MILRELLEAEQFPPLPNYPGYVDWLRTVRAPAVGSVIQYDGKRWTVDRIRPNHTQQRPRKTLDDLVDLTRSVNGKTITLSPSPSVEMIAREIDSGRGKLVSSPGLKRPAKIRPDEI